MVQLLVICCKYMHNARYTVSSFAQMFVYMHTAHLVKHGIFDARLLRPLTGFKTVVRVVSCRGKERARGGENLVVCLQFLRTDMNKAKALKPVSLPLTSVILKCYYNKFTHDDTCWEYRDKYITRIISIL